LINPQINKQRHPNTELLMKKLILPLLSSLILFSCGGGGKPKITGTIKNMNGTQLIFEKIDKNAPLALDTVKLDASGKFEFELPAGKADFYRLNLGDNNFIVLCLDSTNSNVEITGDGKEFKSNYTVKGSKHSEIIHDFFAALNPLTKIRFDIEQQMRGINFGDTSKVLTLRTQMEETMQKITTLTHDFIDKNPESPALIVMQSFLNPEVELPYFKKIEKAMAKSMPNSVYHNNITSYVSQIEFQLQQMKAAKELEGNLKPGTPISDIKLPNPEGKEIALSSLKGKVVLVDFWASWCGPCRAESPNVLRLYEKYNKKGFEVFSVSLDEKKELWTAAIKADGLKWPYHVSDLAQWNSVVVKQFGITGIPFTLLIDKQGNLIDKGLRGTALEAKLQEIFGS
jgi:thiol-disulfide isomerase/thioredoxin